MRRSIKARTARSPIHDLIVIEGIDGSGKTTVARMLAKTIGAKYVRTPPTPFEATRSYIDKYASLETRFLFYLCSVAYASDLIRNVLATHDVVCDRYIASTVAYHRAMGVRLKWNVDDLGLVQPKHVFMLYVSDERERMKRIKQRGQMTASDRLLEDSILRRKMTNEFRRFNWTQIDTTNRRPAQVVELIKAYL